jgi:hypothetical protein
MSELRFKALNIEWTLDIITADELVGVDNDIKDVDADYKDIVASVANLGENSDDEDGGEDFFVDPVTHKTCWKAIQDVTQWRMPTIFPHDVERFLDQK